MAETALAIAIMIHPGAELGLAVARSAGNGEGMVTKTIAVDVDAYERLRRARIEPEESFSQVTRNAEHLSRIPSLRVVEYSTQSSSSA